MVSRREALRRMSGLAAGAAAMGCTGDAVPNEGAGAASTAGTASTAGAATGEPGTTALGPLGLQLYTVRSEMENGVEQTLERVAAIGYQEVEFAGYFGHSPTEIREMLARTGLRSPATHIALAVETALARILDDANTIGHEYLVVPSIPQSLRADLDGWRRTAATMTGAGEQARAAGLKYAYHNHDFEFIEMDGRVAFDVFCEESDPDLVKIELDLFWIIHGGGDPVAFFNRWPGRVPLVHVKDRTAEGEMVDVGAGAIDWVALFQYIDQAGIEHFLVEHDRPDGAFRSIEASYQYLSELEI